MLRIALTGGIASGKSAATAAFSRLGVPIIDADELAREVVAPGTDGLAALTGHFGTDILDEHGGLKRAQLRDIVFNDAAALSTLNAMLHPLIRALAEGRRNQLHRDGHSYAIEAIPLLVETDQQDNFERVLLIDVPTSVQLSRLMKRDDLDEAQAQRMLESQASRETRLRIADDVIVNDRELQHLEAAVHRLHHRYQRLAQRGHFSQDTVDSHEP